MSCFVSRIRFETCRTTYANTTTVGKQVRRSCGVMKTHLAASMLIMVFSTVYFQSLMTPTQDMLFYYKVIS